MEHEDDSVTSCNWCTWNNPQKINKGTRWLRNKKTSGDHSNYSIIKISQNTEKSPGDLSWLAAIQTPEKDHQLMLGWKTCKEQYHKANYKNIQQPGYRNRVGEWKMCQAMNEKGEKRNNCRNRTTKSGKD